MIAEVKENARLDRIATEKAAQRARMDTLASRGERVWADIDRRNAQGYDRAAEMLSDLKALAASRGEAADFTRRLMRLRETHARKAILIKRLIEL